MKLSCLLLAAAAAAAAVQGAPVGAARKADLASEAGVAQGGRTSVLQVADEPVGDDDGVADEPEAKPGIPETVINGGMSGAPTSSQPHGAEGEHAPGKTADGSASAGSTDFHCTLCQEYHALFKSAPGQEVQACAQLGDAFKRSCQAFWYRHGERMVLFTKNSPNASSFDVCSDISYIFGHSYCKAAAKPTYATDFGPVKDAPAGETAFPFPSIAPVHK